MLVVDINLILRQNPPKIVDNNKKQTSGVISNMRKEDDSVFIGGMIAGWLTRLQDRPNFQE